MDEAILPPDDPQPKRPRPSRTAWIRREPPADATDRLFFLLERIDRVYSLFIMQDLKRLYQAAGEARPSAHVLRQVRKEFGHAKSTAAITVLLLHDAWQAAAQEPSRRQWVTKRRADETWLRQQLGTLEDAQ
jgi:hypothetical protein